MIHAHTQDDFPLASLPVIGYTVSLPSDADNMSKTYVFKLQYKTHIYFFRAESEYAFTKWMQVIQSTKGGGDGGNPNPALSQH